MWNKTLAILSNWWKYNNNNNISRELECKEEENYDKVMESYTNYLTVFYNLALVYKQWLKKRFI